MNEPGYINFDELKRRFELLNWVVEENKDCTHYLFNSPDKETIITVGKHQYDDKPTRWKKIKSSFTRDNRDLSFVWISPFEIPKYFNLKTQKLEEPEVEDSEDSLVKEIPFYAFPTCESDKFVIKHNDRWKKVADLDFIDMTILLKDGSLIQLQNLDSLITIKPSTTKEFFKRQKEIECQRAEI